MKCGLRGLGDSPTSGRRGDCITIALLASFKNGLNEKVDTNLNIEKHQGRKGNGWKQ